MQTLHVGEATVSRDISSLRHQAQINLRTHINDKLPGQTVTMTDNKTVLQALALIEQETETPRRISSLFKKSCYANNVVMTKMLIDLLFKELSCFP